MTDDESNLRLVSGVLVLSPSTGLTIDPHRRA